MACKRDVRCFHASQCYDAIDHEATAGLTANETIASRSLVPAEPHRHCGVQKLGGRASRGRSSTIPAADTCVEPQSMAAQ